MMKINHWTQLIFVVVVAIGAMVGVNHLMWGREPQIAENRVLADAPKWPSNLRGLNAYRKRTDAYVADNFPARSWFIASINYARYRLGYSGTPRVIVGRDGWLFYDDGNHMMQLRHNMQLSEEQLDAWLATFAARTEYLKRKGIAYFVVAPPVKERIFPELTPAWASGPGLADADAIEAKVKAAGMTNFIPLKQTLADARIQQPRIYSHFDTHWTGYGAYVGYVRIMDALRANGQMVDKPLPLSAFTLIDKPVHSRPQDLASMLGISSFVQQDFPQFHNAEQDAALKVTYLTDRRDWTGDRIIDTGHAGKPVLQLVVDSFSNDLLPYLYPHFSRIVVSHNQNGFFRYDLTEAYRPNIVMIEVLESGVRHSMGPAMQPSPELARQLSQVPPIGMASGKRAIFQPAGNDRISGQERAAATYTCNLETFSVTNQVSGELVGSGWIADLTNGVTSDRVTLLVQSGSDSYAASMQGGVERPDVASYFKKPGLIRSGFLLNIHDAALKDGLYDVFVAQQDGDGRLICRTNRRLEVAQGKITAVLIH